MSDAFTVRLANWERDLEAIKTIREAVFVVEQHVDPEIEWDGLDDRCMQALAEDENRDAIGTGRLHPSGKIGRMAVFKAWRGKGVGTALLKELLDLAGRRGIRSVLLDAQVRAMGFYARLGFRPIGDEFLDAGIPHKQMVLDLDSRS